ncbi:unnamed protein product [Alternaria burnsii]|nr:unnamed protein product [Alternaria burnsii]
MAAALPFPSFHALTRSAFVAFSCRLRRGPVADASVLSLGAGCSGLHKLHNLEKRGASTRRTYHRRQTWHNSSLNPSCCNLIADADQPRIGNLHQTPQPHLLVSLLSIFPTRKHAALNASMIVHTDSSPDVDSAMSASGVGKREIL